MNEKTTVSLHPLIDLLGPGDFWDDVDLEADVIEHMRKGYLTMVVSVPMEPFLPALKERSGRATPSWEDWAALRYYLQERLEALARACALSGFAVPPVLLASPAGDGPDVAAVRARQLAALDRIAGRGREQDEGAPESEDLFAGITGGEGEEGDANA